MQVVCLQEEAFYALFVKVLEHIEAKVKDKPAKWIDGEEAMSILKIRFSQPQKKIILYDRDSINEYIENYARETF